MPLRFGACRLDLEQRLLLREGREQDLTPKAFDLLRLLVSARPRVLTKAEIMDVVWPDLFVAEANVAILIGDIRAAIGDSAGTQSLIKTHHAVGYSFVGEVSELVRAAHYPPAGPRYLLAIDDRRIGLPHGSFLVGRDASCDVVLSDSSVSRRHARLILSPNDAQVEDLDSKNGTRLNGERLSRVASLSTADRLEFGAVLGTFEVDRLADGSTATLDKPAG